MEKEPYKVARELLEKYDPKNPQLLPRQVPITDTQQTGTCTCTYCIIL